jgi:hypothetical protein
MGAAATSGEWQQGWGWVRGKREKRSLAYKSEKASLEVIAQPVTTASLYSSTHKKTKPGAELSQMGYKVDRAHHTQNELGFLYKRGHCSLE